MAAVFESIATVEDSTFNNTIIVGLPSGTVDGDILVFVVEWFGSAITVTEPSGLTQIGTTQSIPGRNCQAAAYWKEASSEPSTYTYTFSGNTSGCAAVVRVSGADLADPVPEGSGQTNATSTSVTSPSIPLLEDSLSIFFGFLREGPNEDWTPPSGYTERADLYDSAADGQAEIATFDVPADTTTDAVATIGNSRENGAFLINVAPGIVCDPPANAGGTNAPSISGDAEVGETLTVDPGFWTGDATITFTYQWYRVCGTLEELITGETATSYEVTEDDIGCDLFCEVTATNGCAPDGVEDTDTVGPVPEPPTPPVNTVPPAITGVPQPGHVLTTTDGTWTGTPTITFAYQWQMDCSTGFIDLFGETNNTLLLTDEMVGCEVRCVVTATNGEGSESANSNEVLVQANIPAAVEICQGSLWRFVVTDLETEVVTWLDGLARNRTATFILNAASVATGTVPSDDPRINIYQDGEPYFSEGNRLLYGFRQEAISATVDEWVPRFAGIIMQVEDSAQSDNSDTAYTAYDPWQYLRARPVRNGDDFDYTLPGVAGSSYTDTRIDVIIGLILKNTIVTDGPVHIDAGTAYGGTAFWEGTIEECEQIDINFQQGTSVGDAWDELVSGNQADIILTPIYDPSRRPGYTHDLSIFTQAGAIRDSSVFGWDQVPRNLIGLSRLIEGTGRANTVKFFSGPGGSATGGQVIPEQVDAASETKYGSYWYQQFFPGQNVAEAVEALAEAALGIRATGKRTVAMTPSPDCATALFTGFYLGDRVPVYASDRFREKLVGYQRIYGIPVSIADDSTETIERLLASKEGVA